MDAGRHREREAAAKARAAGIEVVMDRCLKKNISVKILIFHSRYNVSFRAGFISF